MNVFSQILTILCNLFLVLFILDACVNIKRLAVKFTPKKSFGSRFSFLVSAGQIEEAKKILFEEITKEWLFEKSFYSKGDTKKYRATLIKKYKPFLDLVDVTLDFSKDDELMSELMK